jgi:hypothetical protein
MPGKEFLFGVKGNVNTNEDELEFMLGENVIMLEPDSTMADILVIAEIYDSKTKAKKDGWVQPVPTRYYEKIVGKLHTGIYVWNPQTPIINEEEENKLFKRENELFRKNKN